MENSHHYVIVGIQVRNKNGSQRHSNAVFDKLSVSNAVCKIGSAKYHVDGIDCDYTRDKNDQAYHEIENFVIHYTETNLLSPCISLHKFRTNYICYVFDLSKQNHP